MEITLLKKLEQIEQQMSYLLVKRSKFNIHGIKA